MCSAGAAGGLGGALRGIHGGLRGSAASRRAAGRARALRRPPVRDKTVRTEPRGAAPRGGSRTRFPGREPGALLPVGPRVAAGGDGAAPPRGDNSAGPWRRRAAASTARAAPSPPAPRRTATPLRCRPAAAPRPAARSSPPRREAHASSTTASSCWSAVTRPWRRPRRASCPTSPASPAPGPATSPRSSPPAPAIRTASQWPGTTRSSRWTSDRAPAALLRHCPVYWSVVLLLFFFFPSRFVWVFHRIAPLHPLPLTGLKEQRLEMEVLSTGLPSRAFPGKFGKFQQPRHWEGTGTSVPCKLLGPG